METPENTFKTALTPGDVQIGLGVLRRDEAVRYKSLIESRLMQALKAALDPGA